MIAGSETANGAARRRRTIELGNLRAWPPLKHGAEVSSVVSCGPADGIITPGDVFVRIDDKPVRDPEGVAKAVETHKPGEEVSIELRSSAGTSQTVKVRLGTRPRTP